VHFGEKLQNKQTFNVKVRVRKMREEEKLAKKKFGVAELFAKLFRKEC